MEEYWSVDNVLSRRLVSLKPPLEPLWRLSIGCRYRVELPRNQGPPPPEYECIPGVKFPWSLFEVNTNTTTSTTKTTTSTLITSVSLNTITPYGQQHLDTRPPPEHEGHVVHRYPEVVLTDDPVVEEPAHSTSVQENHNLDIPSPVNGEPQFITSAAITPLDTTSYELSTFSSSCMINDIVPSRPVLSKLPVQRYGFPSEEMFDYPDRYAQTRQLPTQYPTPQPRQQSKLPPQPQPQQALLPQNHQYFEQAQHQQHYPIESPHLQQRNSQPTQSSPSRSEQQPHEISQPQLPPFEGYPSQHPQCRDTVIVDERGVRIYPAIFEKRQDGTQAQVPIFSESAVVPLEAIQAALEGAASSRNNGWSLFVFNLAGSTDDKDLYELFTPYAPIVSCAVVKYDDTNTCRGFGFVVLPFFDIANRAIQELNLSMFNGKVIQVSFKKHKEFKKENHQ